MSGFGMEGAIREWIKWVAWLVGISFAAFFFLDARHAHPPDVVQSEARLNRTILMKESARYAEVAKFYTDKLQGGEALTEAEANRLDLVQREQKRIHEMLVEDKDG